MREDKSFQTGLPPTYEEYLCHKYAMISRSHTPPPPWSDSTSTTTTTPTAPTVQTRRELLASQPELREYLAQLSLSQNNDRSAGHHHHHHHHLLHHQPTVLRDSSYLSNQQASREQARAQQRPRAMPPRWVLQEREREKPRYNSDDKEDSTRNSNRPIYRHRSFLLNKQNLVLQTLFARIEVEVPRSCIRMPVLFRASRSLELMQSFLWYALFLTHSKQQG